MSSTFIEFPRSHWTKTMRATIEISCLIVVLFVQGYKTKSVDGNGVTCDDIKTIVNTHNELRLSVARGELEGQPKASNMQKFAWNEELASRAQKWSETHKFEHSDGNPKPGSIFSYIGQNLFFTNNSGEHWRTDWDAVIKGWFHENVYYQYARTKELANFTLVGHYTQLVWADTKYVGCGISPFSRGDEFIKIYVCEYGNSGNFEDDYPYEIGEGCEDLCCDERCNKLYGKHC